MSTIEKTNGASLASRAKAFAPYVIVAALFAAGLYALYKLLAPIDLRAVMQQVRATPAPTLALAFLATLGGYAALIGYDWSALRYIGKSLPFRVVALGGFLGYAFGNTIGLNAVSGGAVRYRIYSALGLDGFDVAAIATFASLSFGFGATIIGLASLAFHPDALQSFVALDPASIRWGAAAMLLALVLALGGLASRRSEIHLWRFRIRAPSPSIMAGQVGFTIVDLTLSALTLYVLLPASDLGFATFLAVFAAATMIGVLSHVPGGVGVFESVVIAALSPSVPLDQAAAALLLYRLIYYLAPFGLAILLLALSETGVARARLGRHLGPSGEIGRSAVKAVSSVAPVAIAAMVFGSGLWMLVSTLVPNMSEAADELELLLPLAFVEGGALLSSLIGAVLVIVAHGLVRRMDGAFWIATAALWAGAGAALLHGVDYDRAILLAVVALVIFPCRREFYRPARLTRTLLTPSWFVLISGVVISGAFLLFFAHKSTAYAHELWWQFAVDEAAPTSMRAGVLASFTLFGLLVFIALRPAKAVSRPSAVSDLDRVARIIGSQPNPDANLVLTGDKRLHLASSLDAFVMYGVQGRSWIALGDPIGPRESASETAWSFMDAASRAGARPAFYEVSEAFLPLWIDMGLKLHKLGEEAIVDLAGFDLAGGARKRLRSAHNKALKDGLALEILQPPHTSALLSSLQRISDSWLAEKRSREKRFSVGRFTESYLNRLPLAVVRTGAEPVAFANLLVTDEREMATIDLMRHSADAPSGVMEFLFTELMLQMKAGGYRRFSLGMAPLSGLESRRGATLWTRFGAQLYRHGGHFYNFEGLRRFKDKFDPDWRPRYLACSTAMPPLVVLADVSILIAGGVRGVVSQ